MAKSVLLERLGSIHPFESYTVEKLYPTYEGRPRFPFIHPIDKDTPDWVKGSLRQKLARVGRYRGLRPASALLPNNNNVDLDDPKFPRVSPKVLPLNCPNPYPDGKRRPKPLRETLWSKPLPEHHSLRVSYPENLPSDDASQFEQKKLD